MDTVILSKSNKTIKQFEKLKMTKYAKKEGLVLLEGKRLIMDAYNFGIKFKALLYTDEDLVKSIKQDYCDFYKTSDAVFDVLSQTKNSQGVIAVAYIPKKVFEMPKTNFLVLDNVSDPGNFGTIVRTAVACGFNTIFTLNGVDAYNDKVLRSTMGTIFKCNIVPINLDELKIISSKFDLVCADMDGESVYSFKKDSKMFGIVLGNEANGVNKEVKSLCKKIVSLPMENGVESLNVAVTASVLMYMLK